MKNVKTQTVEREINKQQLHNNKDKGYHRKRDNYKNVGINVNMMGNYKQGQSQNFFQSFDNGQKSVMKKDVSQTNKNKNDVRVNMFSLDDTKYWSCNQEDQQTDYWKLETIANKKMQNRQKQETSRLTIAKRKEKMANIYRQKKRTNQNSNSNSNINTINMKCLNDQYVKFQRPGQRSHVQISLINETMLEKSSYQDFQSFQYQDQVFGDEDINHYPATMIKQQNKSTDQNKPKIKPAYKNTHGTDRNKRPQNLVIMPKQTQQFISIDSQQQPTTTKKPTTAPHSLKLPTNSPGLQNRSYHIPAISEKQMPFNQNLSFLTQIEQQRQFTKEKDRLTSEYKVKSSLVMHVSRKNIPIHVQWDNSEGSSFSQISTFRRRLC